MIRANENRIETIEKTWDPKNRGFLAQTSTSNTERLSMTG